VHRRGISDLIAALFLVGVVVFGGVLVYNYFQNNASAITSANIQVYAVPVGEYVQVTVKNLGSSKVKIVSVYLDDNDVTADLGWANVTLEPGQTLQGLTTDPGLAPGSHVVIVTYEVDGQTLTASAEFTK